MIFVTDETKQDPVKRWNLPDEIFFAAGACHVLAYAFLQKYSKLGFRPVWIKPTSGHRGNHIFVTNGNVVFDYQGLTPYEKYIENLEVKMKSFFYEWSYELIELPEHVLISESESKQFDGLWLREPNQFLKNALPRAEQYLGNYSKEINLMEKSDLVDQFEFKMLKESDFELLCRWQQEPHVKKWWDNESYDEAYEKCLSRTSSDMLDQYLVYYQRKPIGYIQKYNASKVGDGWWEGYPDDVIGIDQYIGDSNYIGKGFGAKIIKAFLNFVKDADTRQVIVDPSPDNIAAIKCYKKAGFVGQGEITTPGGKALLMKMDL